MSVRRIIVAISGASGVIYGVRLLEVLRELGVESHLVITKAGILTIKYETPFSIEEVRSLASYNYNFQDIGAQISSGSYQVDGMIVAPCSMKTLALIAHGIEDNLVARAASVCLKERKKLVLMVRETPLHHGHLENMLKISSYGGIIAPPVPAFYSRPKTLDDIINHSVSRMLDLFDIDAKLLGRWKGLS